jgi:hypothetical protein
MRFLIAITILGFANNLYGQNASLLFIPAGKSIADVATTEKIYRFPNFMKGKVYFRDGRINSGNLNYNYLNGEVEFIAANGDTLAIVKDQALNIKHIEIDSAIFYYNNTAYLEQIANFEVGKILKRQEYRVSKREKIGAYEQPSSTSAIESYSSFTGNEGIMAPKLVVRENITLIKPAQYFIGDGYNTFLPANKKNVLSLYQKNKRQIEDYLRNNNVDYKKLEDLKKLLASLQPAKG